MNKKIILGFIVLFSLNLAFAKTYVDSSGGYPYGCGCTALGPITGSCGFTGLNHVSSVSDYCGGCLSGWSIWSIMKCTGYAVRESRQVCGCVPDVDCYKSSCEQRCKCWHDCTWSGCDWGRDSDCLCCNRRYYGCDGCAYGWGEECWTEWRCKYYSAFAAPSGFYRCNCESGFHDCNNNVVDGCEIDTRSDPNNCGGCSVKCGSDEWCYFGKCLKRNDDMRFFMGRCNFGWEACDSIVAPYVTQHGSPDKDNACDTCTGPGYLGCVQPKCNCFSNWGNCDSAGDVWGNGCESPIMKDNNNCGTSCTDCGDAACAGGECKDPDLWAHCKFECSCGILAEDYVMEGGENTIAEKYCSDGEECPLYESSDVDYDFYRPITDFVTEGCQSNDDMVMCNVNAEDAWCRCDFDHLDCNGGWDGCETDIQDPRHCGSCAHDCADMGCTGSEYLSIDKTADNYFDVCNFTCKSGSCTGYTLNAGFCNVDSDCEARAGLKCWEDVRQEGLTENWCCESRECGHDGKCYAEYDQLNFPEPDGERLYVCIYHEDKMQWVDFGLKFNLGRMIQYSNGYSVSDLVDNTYFSHAGLTTTCDQSSYSECVTAEPHYAYQYCTSISAVFDGMFNLETGNNVPVLVSEQRLYDPYSPARPIVKLKDCGLNNRNEKRLKC